MPENMINYEDLEDALALRIICPARAFSSRDIASKRICLRSIRKGQILTIEDFGLQKEYPEFAGEFPTLCNFQEEERIAHRSISIVYFPKALAKGSIVKATDIAIKRIPIEKLPNATLCDPYQVVGRPLRYKTRPGEYASTYNVFLTD